MILHLLRSGEQRGHEKAPGNSLPLRPFATEPSKKALSATYVNVPARVSGVRTNVFCRFRRRDRMSISPKQAYVLANVDRVELWQYKTARPTQLLRYKLDGWDCSEQIRALLVKARIDRRPDGAITPAPQRRLRSAEST